MTPTTSRPPLVRVNNATSSASNGSSVGIVEVVRQPTMRRLNTSITNAVQAIELHGTSTRLGHSSAPERVLGFTLSYRGGRTMRCSALFVLGLSLMAALALNGVAAAAEPADAPESSDPVDATIAYTAKHFGLTVAEATRDRASSGYG
jgi:hypothetical protein